MGNTKNRLNMWDRIMMAITFAESGEEETALEMLDKQTGKQQRPDSVKRQEAEQRPELRV